MNQINKNGEIVDLKEEMFLRLDKELYYQQKGDFNFEKETIDEAINNYSKSLEINPNNIHSRIKLAQIYINKGFYEKAFEVIHIAAEIDFLNPKVYIALFLVIASMINFGLKKLIKLNDKEVDGDLIEIERRLIKLMRDSLTKAIYLIRNLEDKSALSNSENNELDVNDIVQYLYYNICGYIYYDKKEYDKALNILSCLKNKFENDNFSIKRKHNFIFLFSDNIIKNKELLICESLDTAFYISMVKEKNCSNVFFLKVLEILFELKSFKFYTLDFMRKAELYDALYNGLEDDFNKIILQFYEYKKEIIGDYQSWEKDLSKKGKELFFLGKKLVLLENISKFFMEETLLLPKNECTADKFRQQSNFMILFFEIYEALQSKHEELLEKKEQEKAQAKIDERNKVIADLSHSIKNLMSSVIDPLENLKKEVTIKQPIIDNAIKGANLVREIVNAMNLSYKGSIDDFRYDARNNSGNDKQDIRMMILESLKGSVGNMYDGKYFSAFQEGYFQSKKFFINAKSDWDATVSQSNNLEEVSEFLKKYFFEPFIKIERTENFIMGNERGSAVKLLILFGELVLNAVKYSAFVNKENRFVKIEISHNSKEISILVENLFNPRKKIKTTGLGNVVITNFAKILNTSPVINRENNIYSVEITFENFWERGSIV